VKAAAAAVGGEYVWRSGGRSEVWRGEKCVYNSDCVHRKYFLLQALENNKNINNFHPEYKKGFSRFSHSKRRKPINAAQFDSKNDASFTSHSPAAAFSHSTSKPKY
jgi:hypothetical protein